jgi:hypothetical protein
MKEVIIKYKDSRTLELLKSLAKYFDFTITSSEGTKSTQKDVSFTVLHVDTKDYKFDRDEANKR